MDAYERIEKATALCSEAVHGIKQDQLDDPTPCSEFNVKQLLNHLIGGLGMLHTAATGGKATAPEGNVVGDNPAQQYDEGRDKLLAAIKDPGVFDRNWEMPFGSMPGKMMAGIAFMEHVTHAWDVKKATGQDTELPNDLVEETNSVVQPMDQMLRMPGVCGAAVPVGDDATPTQKLMGFLGRQP
jgi:uncharacterized protein (TIGR03086 family)